MIPVFLDLTHRLAVVVGGGAVGRRKAAALLAGGARVRLVCLETRPGDEGSPDLEWLTEPYRADHLGGATLVCAAGPPELNRRVVTDARARGLWVNAASEPALGDFILPSAVRRGDFVLAVGTGGAAPALARRVCRQLEAQFDEAYGAWVALLAETRPLVQAALADAGRRRSLLERWCEPAWLERLRRDGVEAVRRAWRAELARAGSQPPEPL